MNDKLTSWFIALLAAALLLVACTHAVAVKPDGEDARPAAATLVVSAPTAAATKAVKPTATPAGNAKTAKPTKTGKGAQAAGGAATESDGPFVAAEMLGRPTDRSMTINLLPAEPLEVYIEYGAAAGNYTDQTQPVSLAAGQPTEITLDGLPPNATTFYRIRYRAAGAGSATRAEFAAGEEGSFVTQRAPGSTFAFAVQGDSHPERVGKQFDADLYLRELTNAAADHPDFFIAIGDDFSVDTLKVVNPATVTQLYLNQRQWLGLVGAPVFLVNGNHEQASLANLDGTPNNVAVWVQTARNAYYPQPAPDSFYTGNVEPVQHIGLLRNYYAFTWGDALFVVIDPYWHSPQTVDNQFGVDREEKRQRDLWNVTLGEAQYQWFKRTLETSTARYKFVFAHHVNGTGRGGIELANTYEWGNLAQFAARRPGWGLPIHQLMAQNHVTIFFQGHDHIFVRQELDGVIYQTLPEPANPFYTAENEDAFESGDKLPNSGHVRVTVALAGVQVDYVRAWLPADEKNGHANGEVAFSYTVPAGAQPPAAASPRRSVSTPSPTTGFPGNIVLGRPTDRSVTASLLADASLDVYLEYGATPGVYTDQTAAISLAAGQPGEAVMAGLQPDAAYVYRVRYRRPGEADSAADVERTFHTQRPPGSSFTFTIDADPHNRDPNFNAAVYSVTLRSVPADRPDFHINLGDTFMAEKLAPTSYAQVEPTYREMRSFYGLLAGSAPLFLVNGNHDGEWGRLGGKGADLAAWATQARQTFYPNPTPGGFYSGSTAAEPGIGVRDGYYAWTWGDALFVVLDPYWYSTKAKAGDNWGLTLGDAQYQWLKRTLETSPARYKFVFSHNLVGGLDQNMRGGIEAADKYEWGGKNADGSEGFAAHRPGWPMPIHQLMVANDVTIFFHGHDHLFVKQDLDGIVYQEAPQPSYASYDKTDSAAEYGYTHGDILGCCGYLRVAVSPAAVQVEYVRSYLPSHENAQRRSGQVSYTYTVAGR